MSFQDATAMPVGAMEEYLRRLPERMAELKLMMAEAVSLPYLSKSDRKATLREWQQVSGHDTQARPVSIAKLKLMGIGVRHS